MYSPFRHIGSVFWKNRPVHLTLFLTRRCNSRCPFCFYVPGMDLSEKDQELTADEIRKLSESLGSLLWLAFSGGEVFLREDLVEITDIFYRRNSPSIILIPTNGLLTEVIEERTEEILRKCSNSRVVVKLSLDGIESLHDSIRGVKGGFQKTMDTYEALGKLLDKYSNFDLGINTVFCSENQDRMDEIINLVKGLDMITTHTVSMVRGDMKRPELKNIDIGKYRETIESMALNLKKKQSPVYRFRGAGLKAAQDMLQRRYIYETYKSRTQLIPCYAGRLNLVVTETGDLYPCESFGMKMGNIRDSGYEIKHIMRSEEATKVLDSIRKDRCFCTHECYFMTNILFNPLLYPRLFMQYLQLKLAALNH